LCDTAAVYCQSRRSSATFFRARETDGEKRRGAEWLTEGPDGPWCDGKLTSGDSNNGTHVVSAKVPAPGRAARIARPALDLHRHQREGIGARIVGVGHRSGQR